MNTKGLPRLEWERHPKDKRPAHKAKWAVYIDGWIVGVPGEPGGKYIPGSGLPYAFRDYVVRHENGSLTPLHSAMRYYILRDG